MNILKNIGAIYRVFKSLKDKTEQFSLEVQEPVEKNSKKTEIEFEKEVKKIVEEYKSMKECTHVDDSLDFIYGKISKNEYEKKNKMYKETIKQAIFDVESGSISYKDFLDIIRAYENS